MAARFNGPFDILPGGHVKRFRNRQPRCSHCSKKTSGRPGVGRGCRTGFSSEIGNPRRERRMARSSLRQALASMEATGISSFTKRQAA